jgi:hypothetical protein
LCSLQAVSGCNDVALSTVDCPRLGGVVITIFGASFGPSGATVFLGSNDM